MTTPRHPLELDALRDFEPETLSDLVQQLHNSRARLVDSNRQLAEAAADADEEDRAIYQSSIEENEDLMRRQQITMQRIAQVQSQAASGACSTEMRGMQASANVQANTEEPEVYL